MKTVLLIFIVWNTVTFMIYGIDKMRAVKGTNRIRESVLILTALLFGGMGAMFGMVIFNHKTSKPLFRFFVPLLVAMNFIALWKFCTFF